VPPISTDGKVALAVLDLNARLGSKAMLSYLRWTSSISSFPKIGSPWHNHVGNILVDSSLGRCPLKGTILPIFCKDAYGLLPVIELQHADTDWSCLEAFGVQTKIDQSFHLRVLRKLSVNRARKDIHQIAESVYRELGKFKDIDQEDLIR
jgi:hypothetical protein